MQTLNLKNHIELGAKMGQINLTEFSLSETITDPDEPVESFIRSDYYEKDCRNDFVKANSHLKFLQSPFALNNIYAKDFKKLDKDQFQKYIIDYRDSGNWNSQEETIKTLVSGFFDLYPNFDRQIFYVLNKEWFEPPRGVKHSVEDLDTRLKYDSYCYSFFVLIIWLDLTENTLTASEWYCD